MSALPPKADIRYCGPPCPLCAKSESRRYQISGIDSSARRALGDDLHNRDPLIPPANSKLTLLAVAILAATIVWAFTNVRLGKVKLVYAVAGSAHHSRRPFRRCVTEIVTAHLKAALK